MKTLLLMAFWIGLCTGSGAFAYHLWIQFGDVEISTNGYIALAAGAVATAGLGIGLMSLVFYSSRRGYDDPDDHSGG